MKPNLRQEIQTIQTTIPKTPRLILYLDDNPLDFELAKYELKNVAELEFIYVKNLHDFKEHYEPNKYAAIFCDYKLDGADGTEILPIVREHEPEVPIILISGKVGEEKAVELLRLGITDFVLKEKLVKLPFVLDRVLTEHENKKNERLMQLEISQSEEKYRKILNSIEDVYYQTDIYGNIIMISPSCYNLLGYQIEEVIGKSITWFDNNIEGRNEILNSILKHGKINNYETEFIKKDKSSIFISQNINRIIDSNQKTIGVQGIIRDVTDKIKQANDLAHIYTEISNIEKINRAVIEEGSPASIYLTLLDALNDTVGVSSSQVYSFNREKNKLFLIGEMPEHGLLRAMEETIGLKLSKITPVLYETSFYQKIIKEKQILITQNEDDIIQILSNHFSEDKNKTSAYLIFRKLNIKMFGILPIVVKGNVLSLITFYSNRILNESQKKSIIRFAQQASVVLDKMNVQKNLHQNEESYRVFFEKNQGLLCTHDLQGKILTINEAAAKSLNYTIKELIGRNIKELMHSSISDGFDHYIKEIIEKKAKTGQFLLVSKDSEHKTWYYSNYLYDESDKKYVIGTAQDITDKIRIKEEQLRSEILKKESEEIKKLAGELKTYSSKLKNSIDYAKRLKAGMHVNESTFKQIFPESFIIDFPKDIIGGDFYWLNIKDNKIILALADCTGHGVPGALLAAMGCTMLNNIVLTETNTTPTHIFDRLTSNWRSAFIFNRDQQHSYDGMEVSLCCIDYKNRIIDFAGIGGEIFVIKNGLLFSYKGGQTELNQKYSYHYHKESIVNQRIEYSEGDKIYLFSDGYCDQFGINNNNEKLSKKRFKKLIEDIQPFSMDKQKDFIVNYFNDWKAQGPQIDDVMVIGIQF